MNVETQVTNPQAPWIGPRGRIGVIIPSTNIGVEHDCQQIIADGVTWHWADPVLRGRAAFHASITTPDGKVVSLPDAERLRVWVNPKTNHPELFFYASGGAHQPVAADGAQRSFTVVQRVRTAAPSSQQLDERQPRGSHVLTPSEVS